MAHRKLGLVLASGARVSEAPPHFERAVTPLPDDSEARLQHANATRSLDPDSAGAHLQPALARRRSAAPTRRSATIGKRPVWVRPAPARGRQRGIAGRRGEDRCTR